MDIQTLCREIHLPDIVAERVLSANDELNYESLAKPLSLLMQRQTGLEGFRILSATLGDDPEGIKMLTCHLHCACIRYETYRQIGISDDIYYATMSCFSRFVMECLYYKGGYQFDRGWWTWRQLSLSVFRLGQFEYELRENGVVAVHIPTASDLSPKSVDASLSKAMEFFAAFFPEHTGGDFTCRSWLLSPSLKELLTTSSNIIQFQNRFEIQEMDMENQDYVSWLFQRLPDTDPAVFPEATSLQRKAKEFLLNGGKIGTAYGILNKRSSHYESN